MHRIPFLALMCLMAMGCASLAVLNTPAATSAVKPTLQGDRERDEYAVYSAVIEEMLLGGKIEQIVIQDQTATGFIDDEIVEHVAGELHGIQDETLDDFKAQNEQSYPLSNSFDLGVRCVLISEQEKHEIFGEGGGWDEFYDRYPNSQGILEFSKVGFNPDRSQALVYMGNQSHWLVGGGYYVFLAKENGDWVIQVETMIWIS